MEDFDKWDARRVRRNCIIAIGAIVSIFALVGWKSYEGLHFDVRRDEVHDQQQSDAYGEVIVEEEAELIISSNDLAVDQFYLLKDGEYHLIDSRLRTGIDDRSTWGHHLFDAGILDQPTTITIDRRTEQLITTFDVAEISARAVENQGWVCSYIFDPGQSVLFATTLEKESRLEVEGVFVGESREIEWIDEIAEFPVSSIDVITDLAQQSGVSFTKLVMSNSSYYGGQAIYTFVSQQQQWLQVGIYDNMSYTDYNLALDNYIYIAEKDDETVCAVQRTKNGYYIINTLGLADGWYIFGIGGYSGLHAQTRSLGSNCFVVHLIGGQN